MFVDGPWQKSGVALEAVGVFIGQRQLVLDSGSGHLFDELVSEMAELFCLQPVLLKILDIEIVVRIIILGYRVVAQDYNP